MSPAAGDRRHSADRAEPIILSKLRKFVNSQRVHTPRLAEEDTMRHALVTTQLLRQARTALDDEAGQRPVKKAEPQPPQEATSSRLVSVARRARALAARALAARATGDPRTEPR